MHGRHAPVRSELPEEFPIFPLTGALLLPQGRLPLNIFEPRYLAMTEDALAAGRMFGMVQPNAKLPPGETGPSLFRVGCLGRLSSFSETEDGRFLITLTGITRFLIAEEVPGRRGYRRIRADLSRYAADLEFQSGGSGFDREELLAAMRAYFTRRGFDANWDAIGQMEDEALVVTLCMICPFAPLEKQALLEAETPADRAQALMSLLHIEAFGDIDDGPDGGSGRGPGRGAGRGRGGKRAS
jgi:Lon protease-like protein